MLLNSFWSKFLRYDYEYMASDFEKFKGLVEILPSRLAEIMK
jgi:hypothetical protein